MKLYAYKNGSASAKALATALGIKRIRHEGKKIRTDYLINWGASAFTREIYVGQQEGVFNYPECVANACNKLTSFRLFKEAGAVAPEFTEAPEEAAKWLAEGFDVVARTVLNGHSGEGIEIHKYNDEGGVPDAPLYTKYVKKDQEYRLHVFQGEVFFVQRKARKLDVPDEEVNWKVRNLDGGFIYANKDVEVPDAYKQEAIKAVAALGLDFGACDLITEKNTGNPFVLEVNTACGLAGTTLDKYVEQFRKLQ